MKDTVLTELDRKSIIHSIAMIHSYARSIVEKVETNAKTCAFNSELPEPSTEEEICKYASDRLNLPLIRVRDAYITSKQVLK